MASGTPSGDALTSSVRAPIDPRHPIDEIDQMLNELGYDERWDEIQVVEPSLLPATIETDALASLGVHVQGLMLPDLNLRQVERKLLVGGCR